ncbi:DUF2336 domain-containing protein [Eilatimonas milleporae]|uniref:Uncharacterized protein (DUF2336 family) n=1 Tax=Eilatimonas milleporae TaxID=911205 RepID=A0A3M0C1I4_9PROT|nr:DUF2336 domain-containing protein [Eilatimonas milleporae]RMB02735.1 uncharacterized protein (DUF2336 family) [Eilatimonas milleporae]
MFKKVRALFGKNDAMPKALPSRLTEDDEQNILENGDERTRELLAAREDARPEVLYYLADDTSPAVRRQIAQNPATPIQADEKLTDDEDADVRGELARKISRIIPGLPKGETTALREKTIGVLQRLAEDQLPKVRAILAEEIKSSNIVPKPIVDRLARDLEDLVCAPILQYSPLLNDDDLREIIAAGASSRALEAIATRDAVSEAVADDLAASLDIPAIAALLTNSNAQIRESTLDQIIDQAQSVEDLHRPLALRPQLSIRAMKRIAGFVASALVHSMLEQAKLEEEQAEDILERVRERIADERVGEDEEQVLAEQARHYQERGMLTDDFFVQQVEENRRELVIQCLALLSDLPVQVVRNILRSKSGRAVTALAWKAGLTMRTAYQLQTRLALVPTAQLLSAKDGSDYPIPYVELDWHLSYFTE